MKKVDYRFDPDVAPDPMTTDFMGSIPSPLGIHTSASRLLMSNNQRKQDIPLIYAERDIIGNGITGYAKHGFRVMVKENSIVQDIIRMQQGGKSWGVKLIIREEESGIFDIIDLPSHFGLKTRFGFRYKVTQAYKDLHKGQYLEKDTVLLENILIDGERFNIGVNLNTAIASFPETEEDGIIVSESALKKMSYEGQYSLDMFIGANEIALNTYGTDDNIKTLPDVGSLVRADGVVLRTREIRELSLVAQANTPALRTYQMGDVEYQIPGMGGGIVNAIEVYKSTDTTARLSGDWTRQLDNYAQLTKGAHSSLLKSYKQFSRGKRPGTDGGVELSPELTSLIADSSALMDGITVYSGGNSSRKFPKLTHKQEAIGGYMVRIHVSKIQTPWFGAKITNDTSAKSVITSIWPDEKLGKDAFGNQLEMVAGFQGDMNRMIVGRSMAQFGAASAVKVGKLIRNLLGLSKRQSFSQMRRKMDTSKLKEVINILYRWYAIVNIHVCKAIDNHKDDKDALVNFVITSCKHEPEFLIPVDYIAIHPLLQIIIDLYNSEFCPPIGPLKYINHNNEEITTKFPIFVGPIYYTLLDKDAKTLTATHTWTKNQMGIVAGKSPLDKNLFPISRNNIKLFGIDEQAVVSNTLGVKRFTEFIERLSAEGSINAENRAILHSHRPTSQYSLVDRETVPYTGSPYRRLITHLMECYGAAWVYAPESQWHDLNK